MAKNDNKKTVYKGKGVMTYNAPIVLGGAAPTVVDTVYRNKIIPFYAQTNEKGTLLAGLQSPVQSETEKLYLAKLQEEADRLAEAKLNDIAKDRADFNHFIQHKAHMGPEYKASDFLNKDIDEHKAKAEEEEKVGEALEYMAKNGW